MNAKDLNLKLLLKHQLWNLEKMIIAVEADPCPAPEFANELSTNKKGILLIL